MQPYKTTVSKVWACLEVRKDALGAALGGLHAETQPLQAVGRGIQGQLRDTGAGAGSTGNARLKRGGSTRATLPWAMQEGT